MNIFFEICAIALAALVGLVGVAFLQGSETARGLPPEAKLALLASFVLIFFTAFALAMMAESLGKKKKKKKKKKNAP